MKGQILGSPAGGPAICDLYGSGSPANSTDPFVSGAATGSTYRDYVGGVLWYRTLTGWTQISIP